jgi:ribosomal protein S18 acetylase RimI-like enzyme
MKQVIKKLLRERLLIESDNYPILPYYEDAEFDDFGLDIYEVGNQAGEVAKNGGVTILSSKELNCVMLDAKRNRVIGGLWVSHDSDEYSFDIAIDSGYQGMGLATPLLDAAMSEYDEQRDVYGDDLDIVVDVINPKLAQILNKKYGFEVSAELSQNRVLMTLNESIETYGGLTFQEDYYDYNNQQDYIRCDVYLGDKKVAYAEYVRFDGKIYIDMIESLVKGKGYGMALMKHIASLYGYENMERSNMTPDGLKMRQKLDKHFNYTPKEVNNHIDPKTLNKIKLPIVKSFLMDMIKLGYTQTWEKYLAYPEFNSVNKKINNELGIDFNEISDIAGWIRGAVDNENDPKEEVPDFIIQDLESLF